MKIYRFLSFESFVDIILRKELAFVTFDSWQDPYEGFVIRALQSEQGKNQVTNWLEKNVPNSQLPPFVHCELLEKFCRTVHMQSWTTCDESDALWRIYSHSNFSVRIETSQNKIRNINGVQHFKVKYKEMNLEKELKEIFSGNGIQFREVFANKRNAFLHEQEYRLMTDIDTSLISRTDQTGINPILFENILQQMEAQGEITAEEKRNGIKNFGSENGAKPNNIKYVSFSHIPDFIESVIVHPQAPNWYTQMVQKFCEVNQIKFSGKSRLYTFSHK